MLLVLATDVTLNVRKSWVVDFMGLDLHDENFQSLLSTVGNSGMRGLTDSVWIVPGTLAC